MLSERDKPTTPCAPVVVFSLSLHVHHCPALYRPTACADELLSRSRLQSFWTNSTHAAIAKAMSEHTKPLIGSVLERKTGSAAVPPSAPKAIASKSGFPTAQHRSKSVFARNREVAQKAVAGSSRLAGPPTIQPIRPLQPSSSEAPATDDWRTQVSEENERHVAAMTEEEREEERRDIEARFGKGVGEVLRRAREAREKQKKVDSAEAGKPASGAPVGDPAPGSSVSPALRILPTVRDTQRPPSPSPILSSSSTRPSSPARASRKLRFADVTPSDVYVYESAPPSPRRKPLALPPPSEDEPAVSIGQWKGPAPTSSRSHDSTEAQSNSVAAKEDVSSLPSSSVPFDGALEEGTPEDIRRRFFPSLPAGDPSLAWIESAPPPDPSGPKLRFDLHGAPISPELSAKLPAHLGLHHHSEGARAGYTLDDIFLLVRSTVPAQRTVMFGILAGIARRLGGMRRGDWKYMEGMEELLGSEEDLRKRIIAAGAGSMGERGSLGSNAVDVLWEAIVGWDEELTRVDGVELQEAPPDPAPDGGGEENTSKRDAISTIPLQFFLSQIATSFGSADLPHRSLLQLLAILQRLAMHSNAIADAITSTPSLVTNIFRLFILTPIPPTNNSTLPSPAAIHLLLTLASASRTSASKLLDPADALLRFLTSPPPSSTYPLPLATSLLTKTLRLYATFASYGLYSHIATTAAEPLARLSSYILSLECNSRRLISAYISVLGSWITCASDPHQTSPPHEILWSQVVSWGWASDLPAIGLKLTAEPADWGSWAALWNAEAAWLEGARHNGVRGGAGEREALLTRLEPAFSRGTDKEVVSGAIAALKRSLDSISGYDGSKRVQFYNEIAENAFVLSAAIRLWLACFPPVNEALAEPPFQLPFSLLGMLTIFIISHRLLADAPRLPPRARPFLRPLISFITNYVRLSRRLPTITDSFWLAQVSVVLLRLLPGDEDVAQGLLGAVVELVNEEYLDAAGWSMPPEVWSRGGLRILKPFLTSGLMSLEKKAEPQGDEEDEAEEAPRIRVAPLLPTPSSLKLATTLRLPATRTFGFLFSSDWPFLPLDHLLRSGTSPVWQHLPSDWDANETDVVRASLLLARAVREAVLANGVPEFAMSRAEIAFNCMKVFMLEHGQAQGAPSANDEERSEVFRDSAVNALMEALLLPCTLGASPDGLSASAAPRVAGQDDIEAAAARFLGAGTPFFQFYTDFVALYDAVSFAHPLFGALLLPPLAQRYAADYRKLLYAETAHVLGTVRTPIERVVGASAGAFLWPAEQSPDVVAALLSALVGRRTRAPIEGFVRWMAVHHLAANIWPDLREDPPSVAADERGRKLIEAVVHQGQHVDVREVVLYWQRRSERVVLPPACFDLEPKLKRSRLDWVKFWAKGDLVERIEGLLKESD
ncbi:hypothetical protein BC834DRAFT_174223 [Gloeopeniophorella convolvens]|nr:hypothetical protein BC834DRAFT_174223 [Gloeopeniophorella convolvens]